MGDRNRGESAWITAIARNEVRQLWRREKNTQFDSLDRENVPELAAHDRVSDQLERREDRDRLRFALNQIPDRYRRAVTAHFVDGLSVREVADREPVPLGTVLSRIDKGKELLREAWDMYSPQRDGS